ncbi:atrial natriuretic peptide-converting enzyme-like isoform X2 [Denticeps clupeoides]|uniref:atrial natriuretic peptide-converting enzyme-like isoform X2 n=1 Tax=Denticeps clupeoides TaxID=299321 RepID=UPI0010A3673F|nr:atrial natriuretic peptide-converting enzyme-like isoform X2 [Denticeps clupeoides]XP_028824305.1 atrial natriuretic peptide-converting enzyme-like isoform X2 [Denticeps clupeoides]
MRAPVVQVLGTGAEMSGGARPRKTAGLARLLLLVLVPVVCTLTCALLVLLLAFTGVIGLLDSADSQSLAAVLSSVAPDDGRVSAAGAARLPLATAATWSDRQTVMLTGNKSSSVPSSPPSTPFYPTATPSDWVKRLTTVGTVGTMTTAKTETSSVARPDEGVCVEITEPQCHMLPYNRSGAGQGLAVVKGGEQEIFLKFFSYLSRLGCYSHIMLFGCSLAFPQCIPHLNNRQLVYPCRGFCEAAQQGCEPVLQMFNASWPDFLRCSQFSNGTAGNSTPCYTPRHIKGRPLLCSVSDSFLCATGICVPQKLVCNGYNDCDDWSDEADCSCADGEFVCVTGRCVTSDLLCDGYDDCGDLSDERNCVCNTDTEHRCGDGRCVPRAWLCDGDHDCTDKSDEVNCSCKSQGLLECKNGQCVPSAFRCDGEDDCKDGSDEQNCTHTHTPSSCSTAPPGCVSGPCAASCPENAACDGRNSSSNCSRCEPISLELCMNLPYNSTIFPNFLGHRSQQESSVSWEANLFPALVQTNCYRFLMFFACTLLVPMCEPHTRQKVPPCRSLCRNSKERCESVLGLVGLPWPEDSDCGQFPEDGDGGAPCLLPDVDVDECSPSHFKCRSGRCVLATKRCDTHMDCDDESDEDNCGCAERGLWECPGNKACIKPSMICDGFPDCSQGEDERSCSLCSDNELECNNHECVHRMLWCDGKRHCSDSSDEWNCVSLPGSAVSVFRTGSDYSVCSDGWSPELSALTCDQLGLGPPVSTQEVLKSNVPGRRRYLHVHPEWSQRNGSTLQGLLEKRSHTCVSGRHVALRCGAADCGRRPLARVVKRIVGGRVSRPGRWPWQCSLQTEPGGHVCGCVLIGQKWALTVAHCFEGRNSADQWKVVLGLSNLDHPSPFTQTRGVATIVLHPRYNRAVVDYDISVVELDGDVHVTDYVRPACLPDPGTLPTPDTYCYITGWGHVGNRMPFKLQEGEVRLISLAQCQSYFDMKTITARMLCAGVTVGGRWCVVRMMAAGICTV